MTTAKLEYITCNRYTCSQAMNDIADVQNVANYIIAYDAYRVCLLNATCSIAQ